MNTDTTALVANGDLAGALAARLDAARRYNIGFPGATDFDYTGLAELLGRHLLNNVGDPDSDGLAANHTKSLEREVVAFVARLLRAPADDYWGYVSSGGSEGNLYGLHLARALYPDGIVYHSEAAHPSVSKAVGLLRMDSIGVRANGAGVMDYTDLSAQVDRHRHRPAVVVATAGTTMTEAVDDTRRITTCLDELAVARRFLHVDAALSGIPLSFINPDDRPGFDFTDGADCVTISGHKFLGTPMPCGIVVTRRSYRDRLARAAGYAGSPDTTIGYSRSGHAPLLLWHAIARHGADGLRRRAEDARQLAGHLLDELVDLGWPGHRHPHAFTVVMHTPPAAVTAKWVLATQGGWSHVITMPGIASSTVDEFVRDMRDALRRLDSTNDGLRDRVEPATVAPGGATGWEVEAQRLLSGGRR